jgi:hypothetical protein
MRRVRDACTTALNGKQCMCVTRAAAQPICSALPFGFHISLNWLKPTQCKHAQNTELTQVRRRPLFSLGGMGAGAISFGGGGGGAFLKGAAACGFGTPVSLVAASGCPTGWPRGWLQAAIQQASRPAICCSFATGVAVSCAASSCCKTALSSLVSPHRDVQGPS